MVNQGCGEMFHAQIRYKGQDLPEEDVHRELPNGSSGLSCSLGCRCPGSSDQAPPQLLGTESLEKAPEVDHIGDPYKQK